MVISGDAFVMFLTEPFFKTFTKREPCDTSRQTEGLLALSCESRAEVDEMVRKAIAAGGKHAMDPQDHGFMYGWSVYDLDGPSGTTVAVTVKPRIGGPPVSQTVPLGNCDVSGGCDALATFNLGAGAYVVEARATFQIP
jgi:hypothetical protein